MKRPILISICFAVIVGIAVVACDNDTKNPMNQRNSNSKILDHEGLVKRGAYLVTVMGCSDCHSPKKMGPRGPEPNEDLLFSGHPANLPLPQIDTSELHSWVLFNHMQTAAIGPWGVSFAANITPDSTGIGTWSEEQFFKAMRQGKYKGLDHSRQLLPPMPWPSYAHIVDDDLRAIFHYLKSVKPIENIVPAPIPPTQLASKN